MIFLVFSILCATSLFILFKIIRQQEAILSKTIAINYLTAALCGILLLQRSTNHAQPDFPLSLAFITGLLFFSLFVVTSHSVNVSGIGLTTVFSKISVVIPIGYSVLTDEHDMLNTGKAAGIALSLCAVVILAFNPRKNQTTLLYPVVLFFGVGTLDAILKYTQTYHISAINMIFFTAYAFVFSFVFSLVYSLFQRQEQGRMPATIILGILLGMANFGSIYFLFSALNTPGISGSFFFSINNTSITLLSVLIGIVFFREKLNKRKGIGILTAILAIIILSVYE